jgi:hypothetical protein
VLINEVAWGGTLASPHDEWIELHNPGASSIDLAGWRLSDGGDISIRLSGEIPPYSYFLLERTDDTTVSNLIANQIYTGSLRNDGETLLLTDPQGTLIDSANMVGGGWPAGDASIPASMERRGGQDLPGNWGTSTGSGFGVDASGHPIHGTPRHLNSFFTQTPSPTPTSTPTSTPPDVAANPGDVRINEVAWAGTLASASDEWIELYNTLETDINLEGWVLNDGGDLRVELIGILAANSFFLLERTDDQTITDIPANQIYNGSLRNSGETLFLYDPQGQMVDSANLAGNAWPAGDAGRRASMERYGAEDASGSWRTFNGLNRCGLDAAGNHIQGTPLRTNSIHFPTPVPTWIPGRVVINEVLIRPRYDWEGTGGVTTGDEFIELYNKGPSDVYVRGWWLDDGENQGSRPYDLPGVTIQAGGYAVFFRSKTRIALNDSGDIVRLMDPDGKLIDQIRYTKVKAYNLSYGRLPDGSTNLVYGLWPTPGRGNLLFIEPSPTPPVFPMFQAICPSGGRPVLQPSRLVRQPALVAWLHKIGFLACR